MIGAVGGRSKLRAHAGKGDSGYMIVLVVIITTVLMVLAASLISVAGARHKRIASTSVTANAVYAAEAGVSDTLIRLRADGTFSGYPEGSRKVLYSDAQKGRAEYSTNVVMDSATSTVRITSKGYYFANNSVTGDSNATSRTVQVTALRTEEPVEGNVIAGSGGIVVRAMNPFLGYGDPTGINSSVFSQGKIMLSGSGARIGSSVKSVNVFAANYGCGNASNWPQLCGSGDQPLIFDNGGAVYGTVCANGQTSTSGINTGPDGQGLLSGCEPPEYKPAEFDKQGFASSMTNTMSSSEASCTGGTRTIPANTVINGNVTVRGYIGFPGTSCTWRVMGDVYIKGDLTLEGNTSVYVDDLAGTRKPKIVVNGRATVKLSSGRGIYPNNQGTPLAILSFWSTDASCQMRDDCTTLSPNHRYNSAYRNISSFDFSQLIGLGTNYGVDITGTNVSLAGLVAYSFFGVTRYAVASDASINGIGGEGISLANCDYGTNPFPCLLTGSGTMSVVSPSPFNGVLSYVKYVVIDYRQIYD